MVMLHGYAHHAYAWLCYMDMLIIHMYGYGYAPSMYVWFMHPLVTHPIHVVHFYPPSCHFAFSQFFLQVQRLLQVRIEAQGRYLQSILEKAQQTLAGQTVTSDGLEVARAELSDLATKVSNECLNPSFSLVISDVSNSVSERRVPENDQDIAECSPKSCLTHVTTNERSEHGCSRDIFQNLTKRSRLFLGNPEMLVSRSGNDEEDLKPNEGILNADICSLGERVLSSSLCGWDREIARHGEVYRNGCNKTFDLVEEFSIVKEDGEKCFRSIGRPEPRRAGLSAEQVLTLSSSYKNSVIATAGFGNKLSTCNPKLGKGLDLNMDSDGNKVGGIQEFDLNGYINGS